MRRVHVVCEGLTEITFVRELLARHLQSKGLLVHASNLGGGLTYTKLRRDIRTFLLTSDPYFRITTMVDLFKLPEDFPGRLACDEHSDPYQRVEALEAQFADDVADQRFIPYLQLHEFEALILADPVRLAEYYPNREDEIREMASALDDFESPEHVNQQAPPSYRIKAAVPEYQKALAGAITLLAIGIDKIRNRCHHFNEWLAKLEGLAEVSEFGEGSRSAD